MEGSMNDSLSGLSLPATLKPGCHSYEEGWFPVLASGHGLLRKPLSGQKGKQYILLRKKPCPNLHKATQVLILIISFCGGQDKLWEWEDDDNLTFTLVILTYLSKTKKAVWDPFYGFLMGLEINARWIHKCNLEDANTNPEDQLWEFRLGLNLQQAAWKFTIIHWSGLGGQV